MPDRRSEAQIQASQPKQPEASLTLLFFALAGYSSVSIGIVFFNRYLFSNAIKFPVFISFVQQCTAAIIMWFAYVLGRFFPSLNMFNDSQDISLSVFRQVLPQAFYFVGMITFSNTCLKYVQISTYQVARALTLLFNLLFSRLLLNDLKSWKAWIACGVVMFGFAVGSLDPSTLSLLGLTLGAMSSVFQALYNVSIKHSLKLVRNDTSLLMIYNLALSSILFIPVVFIGEDPRWKTDLPFSPADPAFWKTWALMCSTGLLVIVYTNISYLCISITSPVTFNVTGYAKAGLQSLGGILLGDVVTLKSISGILITMLGSIMYGQVEMKERGERIEKERLLQEPLLTEHHPPSLLVTSEEGDSEKSTVQKLESVA